MDITTTPTLAPPPGYVSPDALKLQQDYAKALLSQSQSDPVHSWSQGLGNMVEALVGGSMARKAGERQTAAESAAMGQSAALITALMNPAGAAASPGGGGGTPTPAPAEPPSDWMAQGLDAATPSAPAAPAGIDPARVRAVLVNPYIPAETKSQILALWGKNRPDYDFTAVDGNLVRTDKHTGQASSVYAAPAKPSTEYGDYLKTVDQAIAAGRQPGSFEDYQIKMKSAGRSQVNIDQKAEGAEAQERGKALVDHFKSLAEDLPAADQLSQGVSQLDGLLQGVDTGTQAALRSWIQQNTGIALGEGSDKLQAVGALVDYMAPRMRVPGSGSSSDRDVALFRSSLPSLINQPDGNKLIIDTLHSMADHRIAVAQISEDYLTGQIDSKTALEKMRALPDPMEGFKKAAPVAPAAPPVTAAVPAGAAPSGWTDAEWGALTDDERAQLAAKKAPPAPPPSPADADWAAAAAEAQRNPLQPLTMKPPVRAGLP